MSDWLLDTLLWTGVLLAAVLLLRRPVARHFGPQAAYALWALPFLRLLTPAITLPAWMNPAPESATAPLTAPVADPVALWLPLEGQPLGATVAEPGSNLPLDLAALGLAAWLVGALVFLVFRFRAYFDMRRELLADAREVGQAPGGLLGPIRLVETPATNTPLAFGVLDRVIALPPRFLALAERPMRDLALAHELAHHRGGDLIANFAVQPLFALHWFNPLGWVGWRAMRRDQEAACDARVVRTADAGLRATYAQTIASFAAGPKVALAAPMACPVLGDKSIIHRLRSLTMSDISARRRWGFRSLLLAGALALPLTASISYAEDRQQAPQAPEPPEAPEAPAWPEAPAAPDAPGWSESDDVGVEITESADGKRIERRIARKLERLGDEGERVIVIKTRDKDGKVKVEERRVRGFAFTDENGNRLSEEEFEKRIEEKMRHKKKELEALGERLEQQMKISFGDGAQARIFGSGCDGERGNRTAIASADGAFAMAVCAEGVARQAKAVAIESLGAARKAVEMDRNLSEEQCKEALKAIDAEINRLTIES
ncbi:M56 family metallopeptidase [Erythrobacter sp. SDW2]|uniref:M56 family metallopeptidase n=1 Tax=Erythrobacter sp. SDW2 TaxID=2907154 RepID=UPI001F1583AB|nr:M56 family metallopeptidase [Erythrobacter sp. SDW2]UIP05600.1 M56 family metallopeptidase [Erythrobacter sp. SDW2]